MQEVMKSAGNMKKRRLSEKISSDLGEIINSYPNIQTLQNENKGLIGINEQLKKEICIKDVTIEQLKGELHIKEEFLKNFSEEKQSLLDINSKLIHDAVEANEIANMAKNENVYNLLKNSADLKKKFHQLVEQSQSQIKEMQLKDQGIDVLKSEVNECNKKIEELNKNYQQEIDLLKKENSELKESMLKLQDDFKGMSKMIRKLRATMKEVVQKAGSESIATKREEKTNRNIRVSIAHREAIIGIKNEIVRKIGETVGMQFNDFKDVLLAKWSNEITQELIDQITYQVIAKYHISEENWQYLIKQKSDINSYVYGGLAMKASEIVETFDKIKDNRRKNTILLQYYFNIEQDLLERYPEIILRT